MIDDAERKLADGRLSLEFGNGDTIMLLERKYREADGVPELQPFQPTTSQHLQKLIDDVTLNRLEPAQRELANLNALKVAVVAKETEREELIEANAEIPVKPK